MSSPWSRFLVVRVPLALAAILVITQGLAWALQRVPLRRNYMDDLALAVLQDRTPHRVVLLGDSITLISTRRFQLGRGPQDVANLATIAWTGAAAELFLLERYLSSHPAPQYVVYASEPDDLDNHDSPQLLHYYDWNVYDAAGERVFLKRYIPGIDARETLPAVFNIQENILERLFSLAKRSTPVLQMAGRAADEVVQTEPESDNRMSRSVQEIRIHQKLVLGTLEAAVFDRVCRLGQKYGFTLIVVWPPIPKPVSDVWRHDGELELLNRQISERRDAGCNIGPVFDVNTVRTYTNFNRDGFHLHGEGWEERYAADLSRFIAALGDRNNEERAASDP